MRTKTTSGIFLAVLSLFLFLSGTGLCLINHVTSESTGTEIALAVVMAGIFTVGEFVFLVGDYRLMNAKKTVKKIACAAVLTALAITMSIVIGTEWNAAQKRRSAQLGIDATQQLQQVAIDGGKYTRERIAATNSAMSNIKVITAQLTTDGTRAYQANFLVALIGFIILHFCVETPVKRSTGKGNVLPDNPQLQDHVRGMKLPDGAVKAYELADGSGYSIHSGGKYVAFVKRSEIGKRSDDDPKKWIL